jgi:hypothetical protein
MVQVRFGFSGKQRKQSLESPFCAIFMEIMGGWNANAQLLTCFQNIKEIHTF